MFLLQGSKRSWNKYIPQNMLQVTIYLLTELICTATLTVKPDTLRVICSFDTMNDLKSSITGVESQFNAKSE